jgi:hypothetical protein
MSHLETLRQRAAYLRGRVALKQSVGWDWQYDERERAALQWAIDRLSVLPIAASSLHDICAREGVKLTVDGA